MGLLGKQKVYSGFNDKTAKNLLLDAGAVYKNYDIKTDTPESAKTAGKLIGATRGGSKFIAKPSVRNIPIDGVKGDAKGLSVIDSWSVELSTNFLEVTKETIKQALISADFDEDSKEGYVKISARNYILETDYIDNITYVGKISGENDPVVIQVLNALSVDGLAMDMKDKDEAIIPTTFKGHYTQEALDSPPYVIYYPKGE